MIRLVTIVSTGDAGAARGALEAAEELGIPVAGWYPRGSFGGPPTGTRILWAKETLAPRMAARLNVQDSDGTLIVSFAPGLTAGGPAAYADEAIEHQRKASLHVVLPEGGRSTIPEDVRKGVLAWIAEEKIATLHVTGPRESDEPGIQQAVRDALVWIFEDEVVQPSPRVQAFAERLIGPMVEATFEGVERAAPVESLRTGFLVPPGAPITLDECHGPPTVVPGFAAPPQVPPEVWAERQPYGISPTLAAAATVTRKLAEADAIIASVDVACSTCIRLCFDGVRSKPGGLVRAGVAHATPLDGPDVPLCEVHAGTRVDDRGEVSIGLPGDNVSLDPIAIDDRPVPCPCGCGLLTTGTKRCGGCDRDISLAHWAGLHDSCGDCADRLPDSGDAPVVVARRCPVHGTAGPLCNEPAWSADGVLPDEYPTLGALADDLSEQRGLTIDEVQVSTAKCGWTPD